MSIIEALERSNVSTSVLDDARGLMASETEIINPVGGEILDVSNIDKLIAAYEELCRTSSLVYAGQTLIRAAIAELASEGEGKTRHVAGKERRASVEMPSDNWDNATLKNCWKEYPQFRDEFLRIEKVAPNLTAIKKLASTAGDEDLMAFKRLVFGARTESTALPKVTVTK